MSRILGIDYSTRAIDVVLIDENDAEPPRWYRVILDGADAFERTRELSRPLAYHLGLDLDDTLAVGIEDPAGNHGVRALARVQGAILARLPRGVLVVPLAPSQWRKTVGLPGNASKKAVMAWADAHRAERATRAWELWNSDACDAYAIAVATRLLIQQPDRKEAA